jgi:O-antigen/teichoic acid export membrane protein
MRQTVLTIAVRLFVVLAGLISSIATARYLGPEGRGVYFFWLSVAGLIVQFGNFGLHASNIYLHAKSGVDSATLAANSLVVALVAGLLLTGSAAVLLSLIQHEGASDHVVLIAIFLLAVGGLYSLLGTNLLVAMGRLNEFNLLELFNKLLLLGVLLAITIVYPDPELLLLAIGLATVAAAGTVMWRLLHRAPMRRPNWGVFRQGLAYGVRAYLAACLAALMARLNVFLLEPVITATDYGAWSIAMQMSDVMLIVPMSTALVLLPKMMRSDSPRALIRANALITAIAMGALLLIFVLVGRQTIELLYGNAFEPAFDYVLWGAPGLMALAIISILSQYLATIGIPVILIGLWAVIAALHASLASWLIPIHGAKGAMASQSTAYIIALLLIYILIRHLKEKHA